SSSSRRRSAGPARAPRRAARGAGARPPRAAAAPPRGRSLRLAPLAHESEQVTRHIADLDLLGALRDPVAPVMAIDVLERIVPRVADPAVHLDRLVRRIAHQP